MNYECRIEQKPTQPTLCVRTRAPVTQLPAILGRIFGDIMALLTSVGQEPAGMPYVAYRNMDLSFLDVEIGFPVARLLPGRGPIEAGELPGGAWATTLHTGPYDEVAAAHTALQAWVTAQGRRATGVAYEFYLDGPETPPEQTRTRVMIPLQPAAR